MSVHPDTLQGVDEIETVYEQLLDGAKQRNIRVVTAAFPAEPTIVLSSEETSVETALDIAHQVFSPLISIDLQRFDRDELLAELDEDEEVPPAAQHIIDEHHGDAAAVYTRWLGNGATFLYIAEAAWKDELDAIMAARELDQREQHINDMRGHWIRVTALSEQLEMEPEYRAANQQQRPTVGKRLIEPLLHEDEGVLTLKHVLDAASRRVRENSDAAYASLDSSLKDVASKLRDQQAWREAKRVPEREDVARRFLTEWSGGYGPTQQQVILLTMEAYRG
jgi:hypothetical protein